MAMYRIGSAKPSQETLTSLTKLNANARETPQRVTLVVWHSKFVDQVYLGLDGLDGLYLFQSI